MNAQKKGMQTVTENVDQPMEVMKFEKSDLPDNNRLVFFSFLNPTHPGLLHTNSSKRDHYLSGRAQTRCLRFPILFFVSSIEREFTSVTGLLTGNSLFPMD